MATIQPGYDVVSLFDTSSQTQALTREHPNRRGLVMSLVSAVLVVSVLGVTLSLLQRLFTTAPAPTITETTDVSMTEPVAFQPSQAVSSHITAGTGYVGR